MKRDSEEKLVKETEEYGFYRNWICERIEGMFRGYDNTGVSMSDMCVLKAVTKATGESEYIVFDRDGHIRTFIQDLFDADIKVRLLKLQLQEGLDLHNIAETGELPKVI